MSIARVEDGVVKEMRDISIETIPEHKRALWLPVVYEGSGSGGETIIEAEQVRVVRAPSSDDVNRERDRRLQKFTFEGVVYDFDAASSNRIDKARGSALAALIAGAQPGNLRWANPNVDFGWIAADNTITPMDAHTCLAFGNAAAAWEGLHIIAARTLKDMNPIPEGYADDEYWP